MKSGDNLTRRGDMADCRVRVQEKSTARDGLAVIEVWKDVGATDAKPVRWRHSHFSQPQNTRIFTEANESGAVKVYDFITLRMDWFPGVDATCRVLFFRQENEPYELVAEPENLHNQNRTWVLRVRRAKPG